MERFTVERVYLPTATPGSMYRLNGDLICKTLELPWKDNKRKVSCIPEGIYVVRKMPPIPKDDPNTPVDESGGRKARDHWHFRFDNVKNRSGILIHRITYVKDLQGCIGVGGRFADLNKDGVPDMLDSTLKLQWMVENLPDVFELIIKKKDVSTGV